MTREEFIKQRCEIDKITEEEFEKRYRVVKCNCGQPYCKGYRCLDLDGLLKENQELKKQLTTYQILHRDCNIDNLKNISKIEELQQEKDLYKEVIEEVREYIKEHLTDNGRFLMLNEWQVPELLQILDKGESNE